MIQTVCDHCCDTDIPLCLFYWIIICLRVTILEKWNYKAGEIKSYILYGKKNQDSSNKFYATENVITCVKNKKLTMKM